MVEPVERVGRPTVTVTYDEGLRKYFASIYLMMAIGLGITALVCQSVMNSPALFNLLVTTSGGKLTLTPVCWVLMLVELGMVWKMSSWVEKRNVTMIGGGVMFCIYAALNGFTLAPVIFTYTSGSVAKAFAVSAATFGACALWGYTTKKDITSWGAFLLMGLIGMVIALIFNMFMLSPAVDFAISCIGVLIFAGLTAWYMQVYRMFYYEMGSSPGLVISAALSLYLNFINFLLIFLRLFGVKTGSN